MTEQQKIMKAALEHYKEMLDGHIASFEKRPADDIEGDWAVRDIIDIKYRKLDIIDEMLEGFK